MIKVLSTVILIVIAHGLNGQSIEAHVSEDSILLGNYIELKFTFKDLDGEFEMPDLSDFAILAGPNMSSSIQILNGKMSSQKTYSYYIQPQDVGQYYIGPAYVITHDQNYETSPIQINVYPNPENIIKKPNQINDPFFFDFPNPIEKPEPEKKQSKSLKKLKKI